MGKDEIELVKAQAEGIANAEPDYAEVINALVAALDAAQAAQKERELRFVEFMGNAGHWMLMAGDEAESILATFDAQEKARKEQGNAGVQP